MNTPSRRAHPVVGCATRIGRGSSGRSPTRRPGARRSRRCGGPVSSISGPTFLFVFWLTRCTLPLARDPQDVAVLGDAGGLERHRIFAISLPSIESNRTRVVFDVRDPGVGGFEHVHRVPPTGTRPRWAAPSRSFQNVSIGGNAISSIAESAFGSMFVGAPPYPTGLPIGRCVFGLIRCSLPPSSDVESTSTSLNVTVRRRPSMSARAYVGFQVASSISASQPSSSVTHRCLPSCESPRSCGG